MIDSEGRFVACSSAKKNQLRIINSVGRNIYEPGFYGEIFEIDDTSNEYVYPYFIDLTSDENGVISALDQQSGHIYQYDQEGHILTVFGGLGNTKGYFKKPVSIAADSRGNLFVLDAVRNNIQKFEATSFMDKIHEASKAYFDGEYDRSLPIWQEIVTINADYPLARQRIGAIYYKNKQYEQAKEEYRLAEDMSGYSQAFAKYRHEVIKEHFLLVVAAIAAVAAVLAVLITLSKRHADRVRDRIYTERRDVR
jgi:tetratricopeptide (TPR) repeat protein